MLGRGPLHRARHRAISEQVAAPENDALLSAHEAPETLAQADPRLAQGVEMSSFGGLGQAEIAAAPRGG